MVPPWVPDPEEPVNAQRDPLPDPDEAIEPENVAIAPARRFAASRTSLGHFAETGDEADMRRGLGHYVRTGYGSATTATRRMGATPRTAALLFGALSNLAAGQSTRTPRPLDPALLQGRSTRELIDAIVDAVRPTDGTQDAEAARPAIGNALSELLGRFPDADILNLDAPQREFVVECYVALDVYQRFVLDVGNAIHERAPSATTELARFKEIRDYIKETIAASFRKMADGGRPLTANDVAAVARDALRDTFNVFQDYLE